jgi:glutamate synthase domain-containing protein 2/glutamate synthase domain-containing protein 1/glutamate synthase domain-containing protein 3
VRTPPTRRARRGAAERDACGIGFVATVDGRVGRDIVELALQGLAGVRHRSAVAADGVTGDGAGVLTPIPRRFFTRIAHELGAGIAPDDPLGVAGVFLDPQDPAARRAVEHAVSAACAAEGLDVLAWRDVPVDESQLGASARASLPAMRQALLGGPREEAREDLERRAYVARRRAERACVEEGVIAYFPSFSFATVVYKAMVLADRLAAFYPDLASDEFEAPLAVFHSRFSTNTAPTWERAQPFRLLCHNGEINTVAGNEARLAARGRLGTDDAGLGPEERFRPLFSPDDSDSGKLDAAVELVVRGGRDVRHAVAMLVPEAWEGNRERAPEIRDFFRYHASFVDPWDGPAGLVFTDGARVGAALDRNGLRPLRWQQTDDGLVVAATEVGAVPLTGHGRVLRGRLGPGQMLCVTPGRGLEDDTAVKHALARRAPYGAWVRDGLAPFPLGEPVQDSIEIDEHVRTEALFGVTREELSMILKPMAVDAKEPGFSMGDDTPFAAVASHPRLPFHFLRQRFAQVSNPPIDHLRERLVMSLRTCIGPRYPLLSEDARAARLLELPTFFLYPTGVATLLDADRSPFPAVRLDATFAVADGREGLADALDRLEREARHAVDDGAVVLVVSDADVSADRAPVPSLLVTGAIHHGLIDAHTRDRASLVVDAGDARDVHALACLLGYGADAVCPRVGLQTVAALADDDQLGELYATEAEARYQAALEDGVLKIMSKMGISTADGYRAAQLFDALGLGPDVVNRCLRGTVSVVGGLPLESLAGHVLDRHERAFARDHVALDEPGFVRFRKRGGEYHENNPDVCGALHDVAAVVPAKASGAPDGDSRGDGDAEPAPPGRDRAPVLTPEERERRAAHVLQQALREGSSQLYERFSAMVASRPVTELHDLLEPVRAGDPVPIDDVEPVAEIVRRFSTGAMSHGSLSAEAHETLAVAMNMIGGRSNCGEGGESADRFRTRGRARDRNSRIKQIASGRFGVTPEYCMYADELNIKMAQGSKPGEGGQLPGHKVTPEIARLRHTQPGVGLISPPPHHDIYSIEDLAQLVFDLKQVNPNVEVSVKLVAEDNVGTIAVGVAKCLADVVQISGANGGTGSSPLSSIKHAGMPWEVGLVDAARTLVDSGLRDRVRLRVDGGFKTGRDVLIAALLGADEYSFGSAAMVAEGCIMVRACHRDTCPTGIATQRPNLRAKFAGTPEGVAAYMLFVGEEVRRLLALLGLRSLDDAIGRVDLLRTRDVDDERAGAIDVDALLVPPAGDGPRRFVASVRIQRPRSALDERLLNDAFRPLWEGDEVVVDYEITNADRAVGASIGGAVGLEWGDALPPGRFTARLHGSAGQSFGAFLADGVALELHGEANDYVGKGMGGGRISIRPPDDDEGDPVLAGNTVLYGATGGQLFLAGRVGERFAVRNSGAVAVVEGTGDHACEYMTGGTVVILGPTGRNLGAGMTGGQTYVFDPDGTLGSRLNRQLVDALRVDGAQEAELRFLVERHRDETGSPVATRMIDAWSDVAPHFRRIAPLDEVARIEMANQGVLGASR